MPINKKMLTGVFVCVILEWNLRERSENMIIEFKKLKLSILFDGGFSEKGLYSHNF